METNETVFGFRTFNSNITLREELISGIVRRTVNNRSYWEGFCANDLSYSLFQNSLIFEDEQFISSNNGNYFLKENTTWDLRTGWMTSTRILAYNGDEIYFDLQLELSDNGEALIFNLPANTVIGSILFIVISFLLIVTFSFQQKRRF